MGLAIFALVMSAMAAAAGPAKALKAFFIGVLTCFLLIAGLWWLIGLLPHPNIDAEIAANLQEFCREMPIAKGCVPNWPAIREYCKGTGESKPIQEWLSYQPECLQVKKMKL